MNNNIILKNARIVSPADNLDEVMDIEIQDGVIVDIAKNIDWRLGGANCVDFSSMVIVPGLIDMHCHLREPGFEYKETIKTGVESALSGGFSAICPMANTYPAVDNVDTLKYTMERAEGIGFYPICAVTKGLRGEEVTDFKALKKAGAIAFSDDGKPLEEIDLYKKALNSGELIISHAEVTKFGTNPLSEAVAVVRELEILKEFGGRLHFAHISTKKSIELIRHAKKKGLNVTCETAPHYFSFTLENETEDGRFKMNPPLRTQEDLEAVIEGLQDGTIDCIATDHAPHSWDEKTRPFARAPFGIVGFETALGAGITNLVDKGHLTLGQLIEKMSTNPAKILKLKDYGHIKIGQRANLTVIDLNHKYTVKENEFKSMCKISPFNGLELRGRAVAVVADGQLTETGAVLCRQ